MDGDFTNEGLLQHFLANRQDRANFARLVDRFQAEVYGCACAIVGPTKASDVVQETFLTLWRSPPQENGSLGTWLKTVARHKSMDLRRKKYQLVEVPFATDDDGAAIAIEDDGLPEPLEDLVSKEQVEILLRCFEQLLPTRKQILRLHFIDGIKLDEIAQLTGILPGTVRGRRHRGLQDLRKCFEGKTRLTHE